MVEVLDVKILLCSIRILSMLKTADVRLWLWFKQVRVFEGTNTGLWRLIMKDICSLLFYAKSHYLFSSYSEGGLINEKNS